MKACCEDIGPECAKLDAPFILQQVRAGRALPYLVKPFNFCPWCGTPIVRRKSNEVEPESPEAP